MNKVTFEQLMKRRRSSVIRGYMLQSSRYYKSIGSSVLPVRFVHLCRFCH